MARRKRPFLDDGGDSSNGSEADSMDEPEDPDTREELQLFENPYKRKKLGGKEDAIYGVFGEDNEDEGFGKRRGKSEKRLHFTEAPAFVIGEEKALDEKESNDGGSHEEDEEDSEEVSADEGSQLMDEITPPPVIRVREEEPEEEELPRVGLSRSEFMFAGTQNTTDNVQPIARGSGFNRGGIGSSKSMNVSDEPGTHPSISTAFGATARQQRCFVRDGSGSTPTSRAATPNLTREEKLHFSKLQNSFGAKLMAKMGWQSGTGLGAAGGGIVTPIETKLRPKASMGLAYGGHNERTNQSIIEEKRRKGEPIEALLNEGRDKQSKAVNKKSKTEVWKKPKKNKVQVHHKTYEQILQDAGQETQIGVGKIYDATSGEMREVTSLAEVATASWTPSTDNMRIPEIRHNLRLIVDVAKGELDGLAREAKTLEERKKLIQSEDAKLRRKIWEEAELISRLQNVHLIIDEIKTQSEQNDMDYEQSLESFTPYFEKFITQFQREYDLYRLDEIVVAAIAPVVRQLLALWRPIEDPMHLVDVFTRWRRVLKFTEAEKEDEMKVEMKVEIHGIVPQSRSLPLDLAMTPYDSLMWNVWLPRVRSSINNEWSAWQADPAIRLYEAWSSILPPFIRDNLMDQLIIPKVQNAIAEWQPRSGGLALQGLVFPWLPHIGLRVDILLDDVKRKAKALLKNWTMGDEIPSDFGAWKDVFGPSDWDSLTLKYIVPKLGVTLREDFKVNPRRQDMSPLERVFAWRPFLRPSFLSQLVEMEFFPKWLDILYIWLIQPNVNFEEVAQWYSFWKSTFPQEIADLPSVSNGFTRGLQLMNMALELGKEAATKLPRPEHTRLPVIAGSTQVMPSSAKSRLPHPSPIMGVTFRSIVEEYAGSHDLLFIPTGRAHEKSRMPLFRVSKNVDGKGGILVYLLDDAVWIVEGEEFRAISLEDMVVKANKPR